jgi:adenine/guanine phosphoribosyltransferase-like PRPP-binding protein
MLIPQLPANLIKISSEVIRFFKEYGVEIAKLITTDKNKHLNKKNGLQQEPVSVTTDQVITAIDVLSSGIANFNIDVLVALSTNAAVIAHVLQQNQLHNCGVGTCQKILHGQPTPMTRLQDRQLLLPDSSLLLVPESLFHLSKEVKIVLVDDFLLRGTSACVLYSALKKEGFHYIQYISLVELDCGSRDSTIIPLAVGLKLDTAKVTFPWERNRN